MTFEILTFTLPAHWLVPIAYGDTSGLDDAEARAYSRWLYDTTNDLGEPILGDVTEEASFVRYHDAAEYGVLACDCHEVQLCFHGESA